VPSGLVYPLMRTIIPVKKRSGRNLVPMCIVVRLLELLANVVVDFTAIDACVLLLCCCDNVD